MRPNHAERSTQYAVWNNTDSSAPLWCWVKLKSSVESKGRWQINEKNRWKRGQQRRKIELKLKKQSQFARSENGLKCNIYKELQRKTLLSAPKKQSQFQAPTPASKQHKMAQLNSEGGCWIADFSSAQLRKTGCCSLKMKRKYAWQDSNLWPSVP